MKDPGFRPADPLPPQAPRERRARHFPRSARLLLVALLMLVAATGFLAFVVGVVGMLVMKQQDLWGWLALAGLGVLVVSRVVAFFLADMLTCPLCHGSVMKARRCHKHADAFRLWPLSYRASAALSLLTTFGFRCMYCGTSFRLGRRRSQVH